MIVPMKKVCLMVRDNERNEALLKLREVGVVHLKKVDVTDTKSEAADKKIKVDSAIVLIQGFKVPKKKKNLPPAQDTQRVQRSSGERRGRRSIDIYGTEEQEPYSLDAVRSSSRPYLPELIAGIGKERKTLQDRVIFLNREIARVAPWGEFDPALIKEMSGLGLPVYLYEITPEIFKTIPKEVRYIITGKNKTAIRLVVFDNEIPGITPFQLPEKSMSALAREVDEIKLSLEEIEEKLRNFADRRSVLMREKAFVEQELEFENVMSGMEKVTDVPSDFNLSYLTGFVPSPDMEHLIEVAKENGWALSADDPEETDETVPTKLKNSKLVNLLNPITGFLGIVPGYREVDISPWFLLFFCIFFGMIFGDAAYGLILMSISLIGILKTAKKGVPQGLQMLLLLSIFNTTWGVLTCSWFGVSSDKAPQFLQDISLSYISSAKTDQAVVDQNLQLFCFSLGLLQLTIAHIKGIFRYIKSLRVFAEIGSIAMLLGMFNVVLFLVVSNDNRSFPMLPASIYLLAGGFVLSFIFSSYEGSVGQSVLSSLKNIISVVLGITNVFSDIMSYIRLWAVGLAGASIATTVNTMAGPLLGTFLIFAGIILLVFGHGLNLILNVLSVLVHGVRLNTLEFSGHVGLTWSGIAYKPFAQREIK